MSVANLTLLGRENLPMLPMEHEKIPKLNKMGLSQPLDRLPSRSVASPGALAWLLVFAGWLSLYLLILQPSESLHYWVFPTHGLYQACDVKSLKISTEESRPQYFNSLTLHSSIHAISICYESSAKWAMC